MHKRIEGLAVLASVFVIASAAACSPANDAPTEATGSVDQADNGGLAPLSAVAIPRAQGGDVTDQAAAVRLGKALFWDVQSGGDGTVACATCHHAGGADSRRMNTLHPGPDGTFASGGVTSAGQYYNGTAITNDDRVGSQGVVRGSFVGISSDPSVAADTCVTENVAPYYGERAVTGRNAPSVVMAIFNRENFWDGRANHRFNGDDPFGVTGNGAGPVDMENGSLASQSVGPPNNPVEMSCGGRAFNGPNSLASKMLARQPLRWQRVARTDSVLGALSAWPAQGLVCGGAACRYGDLIAAAFGERMAGDAEAKFSRIWGQAIQAYESTLIPDQTPLDRYLAGNKSALTSHQQKGLDRFLGKGACATCHQGPELTDASVDFFTRRGPINEDGGDQGFHNVGARPTSEDVGRAGIGPGGVSFSMSRAAADRGAFKTPTLRNVKLTAPYLHNGAQATLAEVVAFYNRGGNFNNPEKAKRVKPLGLDASEQAALVDFLTNGLTDCRTEQQRAPFDHPSLEVVNGPSLSAVGAEGLGSCP